MSITGRNGGIDYRAYLDIARKAGAAVIDEPGPTEPTPQELDADIDARDKREERASIQQEAAVFTADSCDKYKLSMSHIGITFEVDRLRRDHHELVGELTVFCNLPGARAVNGCLTTGDFNFSSVRARQDRAKLLRERANTGTDLDWFALLEEFVQRVLGAERAGQPAVDLRDVPRPGPQDKVRVDGLVFPRLHPSILFGDGGAAKSYTGLYVSGKLSQQGLSVAIFDWELSGEDHRDRLERLFGKSMPQIFYVRCERPLTSEADRLRRIVRDNKIDYAMYDSIAFACDGRPEEAEIAARYFRSVREIGCGSLHVAHINKSEAGDQKPFGSSFWHNGARSTWFVQAVEPAGGNDTSLRLGFFNRKSNLGALQPAVSLILKFAPDRTEFTRADVSETPDLAAKLTVRQRILYLLRRGARTTDELSLEIDADVETVRRTIRRYKNDFIVIDGGKVGLKETL